MNLRRLLESELGKNIISILLGLGLATLFRKVCTDKNCIRFNGPIIMILKIKHLNMEKNVINIKHNLTVAILLKNHSFYFT